MDAAIETKSFKVASVSSNRNSFGLAGIILIAEDGEAWEAGASDATMKALGLVKGNVVRFNLDRRDRPDFEFAGFEIPRRLESAPRNVVNEIW